MTSMSLPRPKTEKTERPAGPNHGPAAAHPPEPKRPDSEPKRTEKTKALEAALGEIEKSYGKGAIMRLGDASAIREINGISTGSIGLDVALGGKGLPRGRVVEIYGPESSGKTTLTLHVIANAQKAGGIAAFVDAEHALDPAYARKLGVKLDDMLVSQPDTGEQALEIVEALVRSNAVDVVVIDSVAALVPRAEIAGEMGDSFVGLHARLMSQALRKLTAAISQSECLVIFINQIREKIGVMFGSPETTTGGRALKFYASVRLDIRRIGQLKDGEEVVGGRTKVTVVKNKVAPPFRKVEFDMLYNRGISREGEVLELGINAGAVLKSGTWFSFKHPTQGELRLGQGLEKARAFLVDNPDLMAAIEGELRGKLKPSSVGAADTSEPAAPAAPVAGSQTRL
jgi:recombination protein RecA